LVDHQLGVAMMSLLYLVVGVLCELGKIMNYKQSFGNVGTFSYFRMAVSNENHVHDEFKSK
jgi:hypothetical protein